MPAQLEDLLKTIPHKVRELATQVVVAHTRSDEYWSNGNSRGEFNSDKSDRFAQDAMDAEKIFKKECKERRLDPDDTWALLQEERIRKEEAEAAQVIPKVPELLTAIARRKKNQQGQIESLRAIRKEANETIREANYGLQITTNLGSRSDYRSDRSEARTAFRQTEGPLDDAKSQVRMLNRQAKNLKAAYAREENRWIAVDDLPAAFREGEQARSAILDALADLSSVQQALHFRIEGGTEQVRQSLVLNVMQKKKLHPLVEKDALIGAGVADSPRAR